MSEISEFNPLCHEDSEVFFTIETSEINSEGVATKVLSSNQCLHNVEILNGPAIEVVLLFENGRAKFSGGLTLENPGKIRIDSLDGIEVKDFKLENALGLELSDKAGGEEKEKKNIKRRKCFTLAKNNLDQQILSYFTAGIGNA